MIVKILLIVLALFNIYVIATVSKASRQDMANTLKLIPNRISNLWQRVHPDDKEQEEELPPIPKTAKMDFSEQCKRDGVPCNDGAENLRCYREVKYSKSRCMVCECCICIHGKCPPALKG